jgi:Na+/H+ antiporter NhaC
MELQFYFYIAYFFIALFIICVLYFFRTFTWNKLKIIWQNAKQEVAAKEHIDKAIAKGEKPFHFENGKVVIYATSQLGAMFKYKQSQLRNTVKARRTLKKA